MARAMAERLRIDLAIPVEAMFEGRDLVGAALPFADESCVPGLNVGCVPMLAMRPLVCSSAPRLQALADAGTQAAKCLFLDCVRQRPHEQRPAETLGWVAAPKGAPARLQACMVEIAESREGLDLPQCMLAMRGKSSAFGPTFRRSGICGQERKSAVVRGIIEPTFSWPGNDHGRGKAHRPAMRFGPIEKLRNAVDLVIMASVRKGQNLVQ
jgi:hypothetical protein